MRLFEPAYTPLAGLPTEAQSVAILAAMPAGHAKKCTLAARFDALDDLLLAEIQARFPSDHVVSIHDMAASSAVSSARLYRFLAARLPVTLHATDYYDAIWRVKLPHVSVFFDVDHTPLQYAFGSVGVSAVHGPLAPVLKPLGKLATKKLDRAKRICLFDRKAKELARFDPKFTLGREDFLQPSEAVYDVVRLANAVGPLTPPDKRRIILTNVCAQVRDGGLLVLGRGQNFTIYARDGDHFEARRTLGLGDDLPLP